MPSGQTNGHAVGAIATRPLVIHVGQTRVSIPVSTETDQWITAEVLRDDFVHSQNIQDTIDNTAELDDTTQATIELHARFLGFAAERIRLEDAAPGHKASLAVLLEAVSHFGATYLADIDLHSLVAPFDVDVRKRVLEAFYGAYATLQNYGVEGLPALPTPALFNAVQEGSASVYALFGGQGINEIYFDELQNLYDTYTPFVAPFLQTAISDVLKPLAEAQQETSYYNHGLDVLSWLAGATPRPPVSYFASIPVSFPLIGLAQLAHYLIVSRVSGLGPAGLRQLIAGATGHSQGLVAAICVASSTDDTSFVANALKGLRWLFFMGLRGQQAFPVLALEPSIVEDAIEGGEGTPTPMLTVAGLPLKDLESHIAKTNKHLPANSQLQISLFNAPKVFVVTGPPRALYGLVTSLRKVRAPSGLDQSKVPFSQRKPVFGVRFLVVAVPYHSDYLQGATDKVFEEDLKGEELWSPSDLVIPVYNTEDGSDLRDLKTSLTRSLCDQVFIHPIHWLKATDFPETATHAIDFGSGGISGIGPMTARNLEGRGVRVIVAGDKGKGDAELYSVRGVKYEQSWIKKWSPSLVKTSDGKIHIDTPFTRLLGKPPIMVAGMTPTTVKAGFVSAVLSAGYHVELAGGGHYSPAALRTKVAEIQSKIPAGVGLTLNALYINQRQFGFQSPLWQEMRKEGLPIEGFCVAAGIPSTEKAADIIEGLANAGIRHVSFKPGSIDGIRQVVNIAAANPTFPIILQWTGGRAGGHHSCEDFHQPILSTYSSIRQHSNISLVGGSGFGGAEDLWPYLTGDWSKEYGVQPMPFDGFLFASRVMVAKEAHTSSSVKDLIVAASGVDDAKWEGTYAKETGGILTVRSELGEPIHKIATRAVKLWKQYDDTRLNADFSKPWFGWKKDGHVVEDIGDMTYEEMVLRLVRLMYVAHEERWVDLSLRNMTGDWLRRVEERFAGVNGGGPKASILQSYSSLDKPDAFVQEFFKAYPLATEQLLASEDKAYFLTIAQRPGQKPVPFIPILDATFEVWFKKDSLWAAEDIEAVFDQDPQRVCILQGPVAVKHSKVKDEPIKDMLDNITSILADKLLERLYGGDESKVPVIDYLGAKPGDISPVPGVQVAQQGNEVALSISSAVPDKAAWLQFLAGAELNWWHALLSSVNVVQGRSYVDNPLCRLFAPRKNQKVVLTLDGGIPAKVTLFGAARSHGAHKGQFKAVEVTYDAASRAIDVTIFEDRRDVSVPLNLKFQYAPSQPYVPIYEVTEGRNDRIKDFYWRLWFGDNEVMPKLDVRETFYGPEVTITAADIETFCGVVGNQQEAFKTTRSDDVQAPMDFAIVTGWQAIMKTIFPASVDGDLLKLVHLSNGFKIVPGSRPLRADDVCKAEARGYVTVDGKPVIEVSSAFLYRGRFTDYENTFETVQEPDYLVELNNDAAVGVLQSKEWFDWDDETKPLQAGTGLIFRLKSEVTYKDKVNYRSVSVAGDVFVRDQLKRLVKVGSVEFERDDCQGNPVVAYLQRNGAPQGKPTPLANDGYTLTKSDAAVFSTPLTNEPYSKISGDFNPIHVNPYFADYAALPGTITHGMWSSAATRRYVETVVAQGHPERVHKYNVSFVGMILPGEELSVKIKHTCMQDGNMVVKVETFNSRGEKVLEGTAEVAQPANVYVFTGQGSQEPGMGMDLYNNSPAARAVWEGADEHLLAVYGFSIVEIVKDNPKEKTIHFGGIKGQAIRAVTLHEALRAHVLECGALRDDERDLRESNCVANSNSDGRLKVVAGHSLGEYSALASIADVLPISSLVDVVFYRGMTMQRAVERDSQNRSNCAMCTVNPSRISKTFNDAALREVVDAISHHNDCLLEIINFNVEGQQYVCAGELVALQALTNVLNYLKVEKVDIAKLTEIFSIEKVKEMLGEIVDNCYQSAVEQQKEEGYIKLERGFWAGAMPFRAYLSKKINAAHLNPDMLEGKYVPNLVAEPFAVNKEYAQLIYDQTLSPRLSKVLHSWDEEHWGDAEYRQKLAYTILVELLAYQFASPVRWIETQDLLFIQYKFEQFVEIGPSPMLTGMASCTLKVKYETEDDSLGHSRVILCHAKNGKEIYYQFEDERPRLLQSLEVAAEAAIFMATSSAVAVAALVAVPSGPKLKKIEEIPLSKSIKDLVGTPEKGEELPLEELGTALGQGHSGSLGKYTTGLVSRMIGGKMPGGFNSCDPPVQYHHGATKVYRIEGKAWLDTIATAYAQRAGISLWLGSGAGGAGGASGGASGGAVINSKEFLKFQADQEQFATQHVELYMRYLKRDSCTSEIAHDKEKTHAAALQSRLDSIAREHGNAYIDGIQPSFDVLKACHFDSLWNWVCQYPEMITYMQYVIHQVDPVCGETYALAKSSIPDCSHTEVNKKGDIIYSEIVRENKIQDDVLKLWNVVKTQPEISDKQKNRIKALYEGVFLHLQVSGIASISTDNVPLLHLKRKVGINWEYSSNLTGVYLDVLHEIATSGTTFKDKNALLTGVGKGSIGVEILKGLLSGGAHVVITTSRYSRATVEYYQGIFQRFGSRRSALTVVPFNQGSKQDVEALVDYIYATLGMDLDYILPFAAVPENGRLNLPTVILPLSLNHGLFGNDGLYSESKISLETLFQCWNSESWGEYLCLAGAVIGWTRGTGLMDVTNTVAQDVESHGMRTFSTKEMAFNILGLMHSLLFSITQVELIWADLSGGMDHIADLAEITTRIRININKKSELCRAITRDNLAEFKVINGIEVERVFLTDVRGKYEKDILACAGVHLIEPELFRGYDPQHKVFH
ncbi:hypothetical protein EWM64_g3715 [Hericium alpestre]|uniref:Malonyl-CoA:ACP transacylase (MAT) domain-containing protein n=1 Tax=Hericium alpestre TaxID=135208 RepID=A0A4Z0A0P5_9AGAM|nr:hypothetical protein EWM64_g3715 [Hericium alpestre]